MAERIFGVTIVNSAGRVVPVRYIGEQHVKEDLGRIPTVADWLSNIKTEGWMLGRGKNLEKELEDGNLQVQDVGAEAAHCARQSCN